MKLKEYCQYKYHHAVLLGEKYNVPINYIVTAFIGLIITICKPNISELWSLELLRNGIKA